MQPKSPRTRNDRAEFAAMECLESRLLLSGNVLASVAHGVLSIVGDAAANDIVVTAGASSGQVVVASGAGNATQINGQAAPVTLQGVTGNVQIKLGVGDDKVQLSGLALAKGLAIDMGVGNNTVIVDSGTSVNGDLSVLAGKGNLTASLTGVAVTGAATFKAGVGAGSLTMDSLAVGKALTVSGGWANDSASFVTVGGIATFGGTNVTIYGSTLNNTLKVGADSNVSIVSSAVIKTTSVTTGKGAATVTVDGSTFSGKFTLTTGAGNDTINIATAANTTFAGGASITTGAGGDTLTIGSSGADDFGSGSIGGFQGAITFNGGAGSDTLDYLTYGNTFAKAATIRGFEIIR